MLDCNDCYYGNIEDKSTCKQCDATQNLWVSEGTYKLIKELEVKLMNKIDELKMTKGNRRYGGAIR